MSKATSAILLESIAAPILITLLLLPFQALTPMVAYTPFVILPIVLFFALRMPVGGLVAMFLSFTVGVVWFWLFTLVAGLLPDVPQPALLSVGVTVVIFLVLFVHRVFLANTPFAVVPAALLGVVQGLVVMLVMPMIGEDAPRLTLLWLVGIFAYGCVLTAVTVFTTDALNNAIFGKGWRGENASPDVDEDDSEVTPQQS